jgi:sporulation protein YlmC with PRC-barrel domain
MKKSSLFLATALVSALGAGSLMAQPSNPSHPSATPPSATSPSNPSVNPSVPARSSTSASASTSSGPQFWSQTANNASNDWRVTKLRGLSVYNDNNEKLGSIDDILLDNSGKVEAVVIGVGGFLGMGEHYVAVPFNQLQFSYDAPRNTAAGTDVNAPATSTRTSPSTTNPANPGLGNPPVAATPDGATVGTARTTASDRNHTTPDHAVLNATRDQLRNAPEFKYPS